MKTEAVFAYGERLLRRFSLLPFRPDESDVYFAWGTFALIIGLFWIYPPIALIVLGLIFIVIAYLQAQKEARLESQKEAPHGAA